jgi:hypothetical protein
LHRLIESPASQQDCRVGSAKAEPCDKPMPQPSPSGYGPFESGRP